MRAKWKIKSSTVTIDGRRQWVWFARAPWPNSTLIPLLFRSQPAALAFVDKQIAIDHEIEAGAVTEATA